MAHGLGIAELGGEYYEGYFKDDMFDGIGVHFLVSVYYVGEFKQNELFGKVTTYDYWGRALDNSVQEKEKQRSYKYIYYCPEQAYYHFEAVAADGTVLTGTDALFKRGRVNTALSTNQKEYSGEVRFEDFKNEQATADNEDQMMTVN